MPIVLNGQAATIVGVMGPEFALPAADVDLWMPMGLAPAVLADRSGEWLSVIGRLRPGVSVSQLQAALQVSADQLARQYPQTNAGDRAIVTTLLEDVVDAVRRPLWLGALAVVFVLLAGSANAANLMLARSSVRHDEIAIRAALGADAGRLARQLVTESALLASIGCVAGVLLSWMFLRAFVGLAEGRVPRLETIHLDAGSVAAAVVMTFVTVVIVGAAAVWLLLRTRADRPSRADARITPSIGAAGVLLISQVAFAIVLVAGTALIARAYAATLSIDPGFDTSNTMTMQLTLPKAAYSENAAQVQFAARVEEELRHLPGAADVGVVSDLPFVANATHFPVALDARGAERPALTTVRLADAGFFRTLRIPVVGGRSFGDADRRGSASVAIVNRSEADRFGPGPAALGRSLEIEGEGQRTIVGIVSDIRHAGLQAEEGPVVYVPYAQKTFAFLNWMGIVVRSREGTLSHAAIRGAVLRVDANQPVQAVRSMADYLADETAPFRLGALIIGALALAGLLLAGTGIYGLATFMVGRRSRELAVRLALGATGFRVAAMVVRQTAAVLASGSVIGLLGTLATNRLLASVLPGARQEGHDIAAALFACAVILIVAVASTFVPALRAARLDPKAALQAD